MICAVCTKPSSELNRVYPLQHVLHDLRQSCERTHIPAPQPGNYAHPRCVTTLKARVDKTTHRRALDTGSWRVT